MTDQQPPPGGGWGPPQQPQQPQQPRPPYPQGPPQQPPPRKKGLSKGCIVALAVTGAIVLVCGGVATWLGYSVYSNPDVQRVARAVGEGIEVSQEAMNAPGTEALREAGCDQAMVMLPEHMERIIHAVEPDGGSEAGEADFPPMVMCQFRFDVTLTCERVARVYGDAVPSAPAQFGVQVQKQTGGNRPTCSGLYAPDGTQLGTLEGNTRRAAGQVPTQ